MKVTILDVSKPTVNGRIYPRHIVENAIKQTNWSVPVVLRSDIGYDATNIPLEKIAGMANNLFVHGDHLTADLKVFEETPSGKILSQLIDSECDLHFRSMGVGSIATTTDGQVVIQDDYQLTGVTVTQDSEDV